MIKMQLLSGVTPQPSPPTTSMMEKSNESMLCSSASSSVSTSRMDASTCSNNSSCCSTEMLMDNNNGESGGCDKRLLPPKRNKPKMFTGTRIGEGASAVASLKDHLKLNHRNSDKSSSYNGGDEYEEEFETYEDVCRTEDEEVDEEVDDGVDVEEVLVDDDSDYSITEGEMTFVDDKSFDKCDPKNEAEMMFLQVVELLRYEQEVKQEVPDWAEHWE